MNINNPQLADYVQMMHRERNGTVHPPHFLELARTDRSALPDDVPQRARSAKSSMNLGSRSARLGQVVKVYWWVPAGFAVLVLLRSIVGG